ncbi:hypothetical protein BGZ63DRAFT_82703 [Mariannaea sp. PMI_226]|nr:hypothetical protein BGZ63DRAFT_82703 [Mariannaea sp. PMI_226]
MDRPQKTALNPIVQRGHALSSEGEAGSLPLLSETACEKCRNQKLRCSRDFPACVRCIKQQLHCCYPAPPNRKWLASVRKPPRPRNSSRRRQRHVERNSALSPGTLVSEAVPYPQQSLDPPQHGGSTPRTQDAAPMAINKAEYSLSFMGRYSASASPNLPNPPRADESYTGVLRGSSTRGVETNRGSLPCRAIGFSLLEIYFERIYNAHLLFDKSSFFEDYLQTKLPDFLLKAVFALASLFLREVPSDSIRSSESTELAALSMLSEKGVLWASEASEKVLPLAMTPSLLTIQTLECLTIFWFAVGDTTKADIHSTLAYRSCCILGYNKLYDSSLQGSASKDQESERRCFWSCWATMCLAVRPLTFGISAWLDAADLPLPRPSEQFGSSAVLSPHQKMDANWRCSYSQDPGTLGDMRPSLLAELMKLLGVWAKVQLVASQSFTDLDDVEVARLAGVATRIYQSKSFPRQITSESENLELVMLLHSLYHLCQIVLHSSRVPLFSGHQSNQHIPQEVVNSSAEAVLQHAKCEAYLLGDYLARAPDLMKLCPVVGFAAFVAGWVFVLCAKSQQHRNISFTDINLADSRWTDSIKEILDTIKMYFQPLTPLAEQLHSGLSAVRNSSGPSKTQTAGSQLRYSSANLVEEATPSGYPCILVTATKYVPVPPSEQKDQSIRGKKPDADACSSTILGSTAVGFTGHPQQTVLNGEDLSAPDTENEMQSLGSSPVNDADWLEFIRAVADCDYPAGNDSEFQPLFSFLS